MRKGRETERKRETGRKRETERKRDGVTFLCAFVCMGEGCER